MEVKKGYNKRRGNSITDWEFEKISEIASINTGAKNTQDKIDDGEYPFFVRSQTVEKIDTYSFDGEAVLVAGDGVGTGKIVHYINDKFDYHQRVYKISDFANRINGRFFYLYFKNNFLKRIMSMTAKSSVDSVRREMIADMKVPVPSLKEQYAIAEILTETDSLIANLEKLIAKKESVKKGTMQQLLTGKKRLPGFTGKWKEKRLADLCVSINDGTHATPQYVKEGVPFYSVENVVADNFSDTKYISLKEHLQLIKRCKPEKGDILLTRIGDIGTTKLIDWNVDASIYVSLALLKINDTIDGHYMYWYTKSSNFVKAMEKDALMNAIPPKINMREIGKVKIKYPDEKEEQEAIAEVLKSSHEEIKHLSTKLTKYKKIKNGLMQNLLTGKIRLLV